MVEGDLDPIPADRKNLKELGMRLSVIIVSAAMLVSCASVSAQTEHSIADNLESTYLYLRISDKGSGGGFRLRPSTGGYQVITGVHLNAGTFEADFCAEKADLYCFYVPQHERYFAVPKRLENQKNWTFRERDYEVIRAEPAPGCGTNYTIHSTDGNTLREAYIFNDRLGLTMIAETSKYAQKAVPADTANEENDLPSFFIFVANGRGFGGSGRCNE